MNDHYERYHKRDFQRLASAFRDSLIMFAIFAAITALPLYVTYKAIEEGNAYDAGCRAAYAAHKSVSEQCFDRIMVIGESDK